MKDTMQEIMGVIKSLSQKEGFRVPREMLIRTAVDSLSQKWFKQFEKIFPEQSRFLKEIAQRNDMISRSILLIIGSLISRRFIKQHSAVADSVVATFLMNIQKQLIEVQADTASAGNKSQLAQGLMSKIMRMNPKAKSEFLAWQKTFNDEQRSLIVLALPDKTPEEIESLLKLEENQRWDMIVMIRTFENFSVPSGTTSTVKNQEGREKLLNVIDAINDDLRGVLARMKNKKEKGKEG